MYGEPSHDLGPAPSGAETTSLPPVETSTPHASTVDSAQTGSLESLTATPTPDVSVDEVNAASAERARSLKELIPQLDAYGITLRPHPRISKEEGASPIVLLSEPAGGSGDKSFRFLAVTERGVRVVDKAHVYDVGATLDSIDRSGIDPDNTVYTSAFMNDYYEYRIATRSGRNSAEGMYLGRDATAEEAMQALSRSVQRRKSTSMSTPPPVVDEGWGKPSYSVGGRIVNALTGRNVSHPTYRDFIPNHEANLKNNIERTNAFSTLARLREGYKADPTSTKLDESFEAAVARDEAIIRTPNTFVRDRERQRTDVATRMTEFLRKPMATIQPAPSAPTSQAA